MITCEIRLIDKDARFNLRQFNFERSPLRFLVICYLNRKFDEKIIFYWFILLMKIALMLCIFISTIQTDDPIWVTFFEDPIQKIPQITPRPFQKNLYPWQPQKVQSLNKINGRNNYVEGKYNVMDGENNFVKGYYNNLRGERNNIYGIGNQMLGLSNNINGHANYVNGFKNKIDGANNDINGNKNNINGHKNQVSGVNNFVRGSGNKVQGTGNIVGSSLNMMSLISKMDQVITSRFDSYYLENEAKPKYPYNPFKRYHHRYP